MDQASGLGKTAPVTVLFDGMVAVHYGFFFLHSGDQPPDLDGSRGGQTNGLCGAAEVGGLSFMTGLHTGQVPVRIEHHDRIPPLAEDWEEVVEVSFSAAEEDLSLSAYQWSDDLALPEAGDYRVRYCARGFEQARDQDTRLDSDPALDSYLIELWPAPPAPDAVIRVHAPAAAYWHATAQQTPPPPSVEARARAAAEAAAAEAAEEARRVERWELQRWGGVPPSAELRRAGAQGTQLARVDRDLAEEIASLHPTRLRALAVWAAEQACERAGPGPLDWNAALAALRAGATMPAPFDDRTGAWQTLYPGPSTLSVVVVRNAQPRHQAIAAPAAALATVLAAAAEDPTEAAFGTVFQAASSWADRSDFFRQVRAELER